jgi:preprotein translocase subunit YajC
MLGLIIIVVAFAFIYLVLLRPQRRQRTQQAQMWETLEVGDEVVTAGGIYGEITGFEGEDLLVEIAPDIEVRVARRAIGGVIRPESEEPEEESEVGDEGSIAEDESYSEESR